MASKTTLVPVLTANKYRVNILDSMCRQMSTKAASKRWPLAIFSILDPGSVNALVTARGDWIKNLMWSIYSTASNIAQCLQCFDAVGWVAGRASGL